MRFDEADQDDVAHIQACEYKAWNEGAFVEVAHALAQLVGQHNQHQRRRNDLSQRTRGCNDTTRNATVVAISQHDGKRNKTHRNDGGGHNTGCGRQHGTHKNNSEGQTTSNGTEELTNGVQQIFRHARAFQNQAHEGEERNSQQGVVLHDAKHAKRQALQEGGLNDT